MSSNGNVVQNGNVITSDPQYRNKTEDEKGFESAAKYFLFHLSCRIS